MKIVMDSSFSMKRTRESMSDKTKIRGKKTEIKEKWTTTGKRRRRQERMILLS